MVLTSILKTLPYTFLFTTSWAPREGGLVGGGWGEVGGKSCCARGSILLRTTSTSWGEFTVPTGKHTCTTIQTYTHTLRTFSTCHDNPFHLLGMSHTCCHCWNTAATEWPTTATNDWSSATGSYVTASLDFTSRLSSVSSDLAAPLSACRTWRGFTRQSQTQLS